MAQRQGISFGLSSLLAWMVFSWLLRSVSPGLCFQDGSELCHAGAFLGVAHPPGFPLWVLMARTACLLPLGSWAFRVNLLSVACISLSCVFLSFAVTDRSKQRGLAGVFAGLCLLWGERTWRQGLGCEVYALEILLLGASLWTAKTASCRPRFRVACLLLGLLLCAHPPMGVMLVPFLGILWARRRGVLRWENLPWMVSMGAIAAFCWLLLPLRSAGGAEMLWTDTGTWHAFFKHATRSGYPLEKSLAQLGNVWPQLRVALVDLFDSYGWFIVGVAILGWIRFPSNAGVGLFLWVYGATPVVLCFLMEGNAERWELMANRVFFLPGFVALALLFGKGVQAILAMGRRRVVAGSLVAILAVLAWKGLFVSGRIRLRPCWTGEDWGGLVRQVTQGPSRFLACTDSSDFMGSFQGALGEAKRQAPIHRRAWGDPLYMEFLGLLEESKRFPSAGQWFFLGGESSRLRLIWEADAEELLPIRGRNVSLPIRGPLVKFPPGRPSFRIFWPVSWDAILPDEGARSFFGHLYYSRGVERESRGQVGALKDFERCLLIEPDHLPCLSLWSACSQDQKGEKR